jgi:hypothetical protein
MAFLSGTVFKNSMLKYKIGDKVTLGKTCKSEKGIFEEGAELVVDDISINEYAIAKKVGAVPKDNFIAVDDALVYLLKTVDGKHSLRCSSSFLSNSKNRAFAKA